MNDSPSSVIMLTSATILGAVGLAMLFASVDASPYLFGEPVTDTAGQMISAGFLSLAMLNWMGRSAVYGGIYGRPIILSNFLFGFILLTVVPEHASESGGMAWLLVAYLAAHVAAFGYLLFGRSPSTVHARPGD
jgi:hypothetical protein